MSLKSCSTSAAMVLSCALLGTMAPAPAFAQLIPVDRNTTWNPGIQGGIPNRTTICATVNASTYGNGASDATAGIQAAINGCPVGQVVQLSAGTFKIASQPVMINKGVTLRGAGPTQTVLTKPDGTGYAVVVVGKMWPGLGASTNLTSNGVKGSNSVTVASTAGLSVGEIVLIDKLTDPTLTRWSADCDSNCKGWFSRSNRPITQTMEIAGISGNTVTFTTPFHITFDTAYGAQLTKHQDPAVRNAGLEDLKVSNGEGGDGGGNIRMELAAYSWVRNVDSDRSDGGSIHIYRSFRSVVRDSYFHDTKNPNPGGGGYGIVLNAATSDCLIENNISTRFNKTILARASGGGNVIGYNYFEDGFGAGYKTIPEVGLNAAHMTTPHHILFEGNQAWNFGSDARWGNSIYITFFRNHNTTLRRDVANLGLVDQVGRVGVELMAYHYWYTFIGNVIGSTGMSASPQGTSFTYEDSYPFADNPVPLYRFGRGDVTGTPEITTFDANVKTTTLRDGNFDYVTNSVQWDRSPQTLPNSLYLTSKPAFFGSCSWPWVDPLGSTKVAVLPARARFDGNTNACGSSTVTPAPLAAPTGLRISAQ